LQLGDGLKILSDRKHPGTATEQHGGKFHRNFQAARKALVDLAEGRNAADARIVDHALDLVASHFARDLDPWAAEPAIDAFGTHGRGQRRFSDHALHIQKQRNVGLYGRECGHSLNCRSCLTRRSYTDSPNQRQSIRCTECANAA
jgi:hypothetical protein